MKEYDLFLMGSVALECSTSPDHQPDFPLGGPAIYSAFALSSMGRPFGMLTRTSKVLKEKLQVLPLRWEDIFWLEDTNTCMLENHYLTEDRERIQVCLTNRCSPLELGSVPSGIGVKTYLFSGIALGDFETAMLRYLSKSGKIAVDMKGFVRVPDRRTGELNYLDWEEKNQYFPYIDYLKVGITEAEVLTGSSNPALALERMAKWGAREILLTSSHGFYLRQEGQITEVPLDDLGSVGRIGRGETAFGAYLAARCEGRSPQESLAYAVAAAELKTQKAGPLRCERGQLDELARQHDMAQSQE